MHRSRLAWFLVLLVLALLSLVVVTCGGGGDEGGGDDPADDDDTGDDDARDDDDTGDDDSGDDDSGDDDSGDDDDDVDDDFDNARIGPEGGNLQLSDFLLEVPEGALDEPTMLSVQRESTPIVDENADPLSDSFRLSPPGLLFNVPIRVTVTLDSTPPNETIALWSSLWDNEEYMLLFPAISGREMTVEHWHFSKMGFFRALGNYLNARECWNNVNDPYDIGLMCQPCCCIHQEGDICQDYRCFGGVECNESGRCECGDPGQRCCPTNVNNCPAILEGYGCNPRIAVCKGQVCERCGEKGQPCCVENECNEFDGNSEHRLSCQDGTCKLCGGEGEQCCPEPGFSCEAPFVCDQNNGGAGTCKEGCLIDEVFRRPGEQTAPVDDLQRCGCCIPGENGGTRYIWSPCPRLTSCGDGKDCTINDQCDGSGTELNACSLWDVAPNTCLIDNTCYAAGDQSDGDGCKECDPTHPYEWTLQDDCCWIGGHVYDRGDENPDDECEFCIPDEPEDIYRWTQPDQCCGVTEGPTLSNFTLDFPIANRFHRVFNLRFDYSDPNGVVHLDSYGGVSFQLRLTYRILGTLHQSPWLGPVGSTPDGGDAYSGHVSYRDSPWYNTWGDLYIVCEPCYDFNPTFRCWWHPYISEYMWEIKMTNMCGQESNTVIREADTGWEIFFECEY